MSEPAAILVTNQCKQSSSNGHVSERVDVRSHSGSVHCAPRRRPSRLLRVSQRECNYKKH
eukprot:4964273-Pleurochrysis_carterae.AAC.2